MAAILKAGEREFRESPGKIDNYRIFTDVSRMKKGINPENLKFDIRENDKNFKIQKDKYFHAYPAVRVCKG